eukprot:TRINITY_DN18909_c0_g1_i1.p1 TRINITY_DN18909_c0_g1~~TRINITY_DN18909_c0_g1_i1.p1  ORF type:complete len:239 (-),score=47.62 TRINITY_DN18909_c0_g1_i1:13-729(-)
MHNYEYSYFENSAKDDLVQKLAEMKNFTGNEYIDLEKYKHSVTDEYLRVSEIIEQLRKAKKPVPDVCCFHCPRARRSLMKNDKFINASIQELMREESLKAQLELEHRHKYENNISITKLQPESNKRKSLSISKDIKFNNATANDASSKSNLTKKENNTEKLNKEEINAKRQKGKKQEGTTKDETHKDEENKAIVKKRNQNNKTRQKRISKIYVDNLSLIHICRCRRYAVCRSRWSPYH